MSKTQLGKRKFVTASIILIVFVLLLGVLHLVYKQLSQPEPSWQGIAPGHTSVSQALKTLGEPTEIEQRGDYMIYSYSEYADLDGWEEVELWVDNAHDNHTITGINRSLPIVHQDGTGRFHSDADISTLEQVVLLYGRPDRVTWSTYCSRYLIWARHGVAVGAEHFTFGRFRWNVNIGSVLLFQPMELDEFHRTEWPWPNRGVRLSDHQTCLEGDSPDPYPEDPYDWKHMPTPQP